jgi:hypothetical protein
MKTATMTTDDLTAQRTAAYQAQLAERRAERQRLDFSRTKPRLEATVSLGVFADFATADGIGAAEAKFCRPVQCVELGYVCHDVDDGSQLHGSPDQFPCEILSLRRGAYVSDSTRGRSGYHLLATVRLAPELQLATELEKE